MEEKSARVYSRWIGPFFLATVVIFLSRAFFSSAWTFVSLPARFIFLRFRGRVVVSLVLVPLHSVLLHSYSSSPLDAQRLERDRERVCVCVSRCNKSATRRDGAVPLTSRRRSQEILLNN